ncbi:Ldh family oxidoreductase [Alicyclobacillus tolerans]|uniref:Ldh family oxidoreductase n=1 Tax=Alicyclobacillus tolerans TaxID=90970 RepID=UPI001F27A02B|nr:Ldh family oxidoreductase [Alicyclobacillus tolerans]MCF8565576.1 Ldh family oxidoreductase [Alicyclobacillus tolerans]
MGIEVNVLKHFYLKVLAAVGTPVMEAGVTADALVDADLHGLETHGAMRIPAYVRMAREGVLQPDQKPALEWHKGALSLVNGNNTWGQLAALSAVQEVVKNAKTHFVGAAGVFNTNHIGTCAYYARMLAREGLVSFVTTNSPPNMPPWGGSEPVLGTNPICFSAPAPEGQVIVVDMATSVVAKGKILLAAQREEAIPEGWALNKAGQPTTDPNEALQGYQLPVGGPKGYGLALFADIFSGVLTGANVGTQLRSMYAKELSPAGIGAFMFAVDVSAFGTDAVNARMEQLIQMVLGAELAQGYEQIYLPGQISDQMAAQRARTGIPISPQVLDNLNNLAQELGVDPLLG